jgi:hypothetical protein
MPIQNPTSAAPYVQGSPFPAMLKLAFRVQSAGAATSAPDFVIPAGVVTAATHASTGLYTLTLAAAYRNYVLVSGHVTVLAADAENTGLQGHIVSYVPSTGVLTIVTKDTSADPAVAIVADDQWLCVDLTLAQDVTYGTAGAIPA